MYFLFASVTYYPGGGMGDYRGGFDTLEEVHEWFNKANINSVYPYYTFDWAEIATLDDGDYDRAASLRVVSRWNHRKKAWDAV